MPHVSFVRHQLRQRAAGFAFSLAMSALLLVAGAADARAFQQQEHDKFKFTFYQGPSGAGSPQNALYVEGTTLIYEEKWARAAEVFSRFVTQYPRDRNADAAYYYLAFAYRKQNKLREASDALSRLVQAYPRSEWVDDAEAMQVEIDPAKAAELRQKNDLVIKIATLQSLCRNDQAQCSTYVNEALNSRNASTILRESAIKLLGQYGGPQALPSLINIARTEPDEKVRVQAVAALGQTDNEGALDTLRELAMRDEPFRDNGIVDTALHALVENDSARAVTILGELARGGARTLEARKHAIYLMATRRKGEPVVDEMLRIYDTDPNVEIKKQVVEGFGSRLSPRAHDKLVEIARTSTNIELRKLAIRTIPHRTSAVNRDPELDLDVFVSLYDSERDEELKDAILDSIGRYQTKRAMQKLMEVVRSNAPVERRKKAVMYLSKSKDPEVKRFLEDLIK